MTGSMYAAVSGLKSHMNALNVIGNNVSNVNTTAYKATRYTFNEALYTTQRSGSDGTQISGGRNPAQVGFGASIGTIDLDMSTKNYTPTGKLLDTMIDGDGFFFVGDKELGDGATAVSITDQPALSGMNLTRMGNFNIDPNGYLVDGNGSVVWGFLEENANLDTKYDLTTGLPPKETDENSTNQTNQTNQSNQSETEKKNTVKELKYMNEEEIKTLQKLGVNLHNVRCEKLTQEKKDELLAVTDENVKKLSATDQLLRQRIKGESGNNSGGGNSGGNSGNNGETDYTKIEVGDTYVVSATVTNNAVMGAIRLPTKDDAGIQWPKYTAKKEATYVNGDVTQGIDTPAEPAKFTDGADERLQADSVTIDEKSGALRVMTSDGTLYTVGYLALAKVTNPNGVTHVDGRYYQAKDGAGVLRATTVKGAVSGPKDPLTGEVSGPDSSGDTALITGGLESSGTDLATEITNMITVQRGYQANTRIVTVTDSMLEELVNMKR